MCNKYQKTFLTELFELFYGPQKLFKDFSKIFYRVESEKCGKILGLSGQLGKTFESKKLIIIKIELWCLNSSIKTIYLPPSQTSFQVT
jgi:hypothetical protein